MATSLELSIKDAAQLYNTRAVVTVNHVHHYGNAKPKNTSGNGANAKGSNISTQGNSSAAAVATGTEKKCGPYGK